MKHPQFIPDTKLAISAFKYSDTPFLCTTLCEAAGLCESCISLVVGVLSRIPHWWKCLVTISEVNGFESFVNTGSQGVNGMLFLLLMWICDILFGNLDMFAGETYRQTDADFLDSERDTFRDDGSTASTAVLVGNHLYVANVGDSRAVISMAGKGNTCIINFPF